MRTSANLFLASLFGLKKKSADEEMWREIIEFSESGKVIFDQSGVLLHANSKAREYFSFLRDKEFSDLRMGDFFDYLYDHATDVDRNVHNASQEYVSSGNTYIFREVVRVDGGILCLIRGKKLKSGHNVFVMDDISTNFKREEKVIDLGKENYHLTHAIEAATSGIFVSNPKAEGNPIIFVNDALCGFLDTPRNNLVGSDWGAILRIMKDKEEREKLIKALAEAREADLEACYKKGDQVHWYSVKVSPVWDDQGNLDLLVGVLGDITLLKQREAEVFHSQKLDALGQLAAGIAHDFNNVLSIIDGFSVMTASLVEDNEKAKDFLKRIQMASQRGAALTRKMLTFSRHKVVTQNVVDLCAVLKEQEELLRPLLDATVEFSIRTPGSPVPVKCSADSIGQIVMNLAINSRDAMSEGGQLVVGLSMSHGENVPQKARNKISSGEIACLEVIDTGSGMDKKTLERVFDPFFTTKDQGKGTGLGMSVVYGLVQEIGGVIDIHSILGQGTAISIYMPVSADGIVRQIRGDEADLKTICLDGYTALIVEDEPDLRMLVGRILEDMGMNVLYAENGDEALCVQEDHESGIDILLTDVVMPGMNGVKLAELYSSLRPETKIIFMSGYPASGDMARIQIPEGAYFVAKPVNYDNLAALVLKRLREGAVSANEALMAETMPRWVNTGSQEKRGSHAA